MEYLYFCLASVCLIASVVAAKTAIRIARCPSGLYEATRQKAMRGERLSDMDVDLVLARR